MTYNILIADDSEIIREIMIKTLTLAKISFNVFEASHGVEALAILEANWIDLIIADINMPVMNGADLIEKLRANELFRNIPVIIISAKGIEGRIEKRNEDPVKAYIKKPFTPEQFKNVFNHILKTIKKDEE